MRLIRFLAPLAGVINEGLHVRRAVYGCGRRLDQLVVRRSKMFDASAAGGWSWPGMQQVLVDEGRVVNQCVLVVSSLHVPCAVSNAVLTW